MTNTFLANSFLPNDFNGYLKDKIYLYTIIIIIINKILCRPGEYNLSTPVLVVQINASGRVELPGNSTVSMGFNMPEV